MIPNGTYPPLTVDELGPDPMEAFRIWFGDALVRSRARYPDAVALSTVDEAGWPSGRIVLVKGVDERGFIFFTNYNSRKGRELEATGRAALTFYWGELLRQVRVVGTVERLLGDASDSYFRTRPRGSRIGAWASHQSQVLESRAELEERAREIEALYPGEEVPRPPHWGGYHLTPREIEFWQEGPNRLHDRIRYLRKEDGSWGAARLNP